MAGSLVAVGAVYYVVQATASDGDLLDLDNIELSQSSLVVATDPDTGAQVEYATLRSSNSHRVWADLEQIPTNLQYAFICTEDKDFYNEPGVNFKRTIGAMINEYLLPIYSSKQGASTLEQQLIKNLTSDKSASGIEGALRKLREIYRALILSRSYSKETILEAYLNTISFTGSGSGLAAGLQYCRNRTFLQSPTGVRTMDAKDCRLVIHRHRPLLSDQVIIKIGGRNEKTTDKNRNNGYFTYSYPYSSLCITGYFHPARFHPNEPDAKRNDGSKHSR